MPGITFTAKEIEVLQRAEDSLRLLASYNEDCCYDAQRYGTPEEVEFHRKRTAELLEEADRIEAEWEQYLLS